MANIIVIGASGTIGRAVADLLAQEHKVIRAARSRGDVTLDISNKASLEALFQKTGTVDAVVCAAGDSRYGKPLDQVSDEDFAFSINNKLMGQVNLVRTALGNITDNGSITLTSGVFATEPWPATSPTLTRASSRCSAWSQPACSWRWPTCARDSSGWRSACTGAGTCSRALCSVFR